MPEHSAATGNQKADECVRNGSPTSSNGPETTMCVLKSLAKEIDSETGQWET